MNTPLATVNPDTKSTADSGSTVNDRFNELVRDHEDEVLVQQVLAISSLHEMTR